MGIDRFPSLQHTATFADAVNSCKPNRHCAGNASVRYQASLLPAGGGTGQHRSHNNKLAAPVAI